MVKPIALHELKMKYLTYALILFLSCTANAHQLEVLPANNLYEAPIADPMWPKFLIGTANDTKARLGKSLWLFSFGENIGLLKYGSEQAPFEFGVQAALFGLMDIGSRPTRLINSDYFVAAGVSHRNGDFQHLLQLSHISSHVGDEYLLSRDGSKLARINLSYETLKWFIRYKSNPTISPYIALGYIVHVEPAAVKRLSISGGIDYVSNKCIFNNSTRFIAGGFVNSWQENEFKPTVNLRAGLQYERTKYSNRYLQFLFEYKHGRCQQGQFYNLNVQYAGVLVAFSS
jgi:hypothetical protein